MTLSSQKKFIDTTRRTQELRVQSTQESPTDCLSKAAFEVEKIEHRRFQSWKSHCLVRYDYHPVRHILSLRDPCFIYFPSETLFECRKCDIPHHSSKSAIDKASQSGLCLVFLKPQIPDDRVVD